MVMTAGVRHLRCSVALAISLPGLGILSDRPASRLEEVGEQYHDSDLVNRQH
jgi:hypothetical protein